MNKGGKNTIKGGIVVKNKVVITANRLGLTTNFIVWTANSMKALSSLRFRI